MERGVALRVKSRPSTEENWTVAAIAEADPPESWEEVFLGGKEEIRQISEMVREEEERGHRLLPLKADLFNAFRLTGLPETRVVLLGQDPYPTVLKGGLPRAVGLSFSVRSSDAVPGSLKNIYQEIAEEIPGFQIPNHGDLREWARQGVLLLNMSLIYGPEDAQRYADVCAGLFKKVLNAAARARTLSSSKEKKRRLILVMWGRVAQTATRVMTEPYIGLTAAHPSPRSAQAGFFGCGHFVAINRHLVAMGDRPIDWQITDL